MDNRIYKSSEIAPNCPRCASPNTKFCYYNNYSLSQPRYFCKSCRRYWTKGGSLRNVPVGGGCRKARRSKAIGSLHHQRSSTPNPTRNSDTSGSGADLAGVFAKYLNQNVEANPGSDVPGSSDPVGIGGLPENIDLGSGQEDPGVNGLRSSVKSTEVEDDVFSWWWSEEGAGGLESFDWSPEVDFWELGTFSGGGDCWNSFDLSSYL